MTVDLQSLFLVIVVFCGGFGAGWRFAMKGVCSLVEEGQIAKGPNWR